MAKPLSVLKAAASPPRKLTERDKVAISKVGCQMFLQELEELEQRARRLKLSVTAYHLNNAKKACEWELACKEPAPKIRSGT